MKKWFKFFTLGFFSHSISKDATKRGYTNVFFAFILSLVFIWSAFVGGDMLPFSVDYANSQDFIALTRAVFADIDNEGRIEAEIENGVLKLKKHGGEYTEALLVSTLTNTLDKENYSIEGYQVVVDSRPASTLGEIEAYCISNDGKDTKISYEEYLTLSEVARLNFDFKIRYTGMELVLTDEMIEEYKAYLIGTGKDNEEKTESLDRDLGDGKITRDEYNRAIYEAYFASYYPSIAAYESSSVVPLLRNYYYHEYISRGANNYLFIFDDYMSASFTTSGGKVVPFYGFYSELENGVIVEPDATEAEANIAVDRFIKDAFAANWFLNALVYAINTVSIAPFIALMLLVVALLSYSILSLMGVGSIGSLGAMLKIVGSFVWQSAIISTVGSIVAMFFLPRSLLEALPLVVFFLVLVIRAIVFVVREHNLYKLQSEQQKTLATEV